MMPGPQEPVIDVVPYGSDGPKACLVPKPMPKQEADVYQALRKLHCDRKAASHDCRGRVILDRNGMTLQCPLCGDFRSTYPRGNADARALG